MFPEHQWGCCTITRVYANKQRLPLFMLALKACSETHLSIVQLAQNASEDKSTLPKSRVFKARKSVWASLIDKTASILMLSDSGLYHHHVAQSHLPQLEHYGSLQDAVIYFIRSTQADRLTAVLSVGIFFGGSLSFSLLIYLYICILWDAVEAVWYSASIIHARQNLRNSHEETWNCSEAASVCDERERWRCFVLCPNIQMLPFCFCFTWGNTHTDVCKETFNCRNAVRTRKRRSKRRTLMCMLKLTRAGALRVWRVAPVRDLQ